MGTFTGPAGTYQQTTTASPAVTAALKSLGLPGPPKMLHLHTTPTPDTTPTA